MNRALARASRRHFMKHKWQTALAAIGIALGVAVVTAVELANRGAMAAFSLTAESLMGKATHQLIGGPAGLPEKLYTALVRDGRVTAAPVVSGRLRPTNHPEISFSLLGIDPVAEAPFRNFGQGGKADPLRLMVEPGSAWMGAETSRELGIAAGEELAIQTGEGTAALTIIALLNPGGPTARQGLARTLIADIATAQEILGKTGRLSRIDLILDNPAAIAAVTRFKPAGAQLLSAPGRTRAREAMTRAFRLNLSALAFLALVVGSFIIFNAVSFSVVERRSEIALLRAQGVTRRQIFLQLLGDSLLLGIPGTALGLLLGVLLGQGLVGLVARTINDLYFTLRVTGLAIDPAVLWQGGLLGIAAALAAALFPAWEAASIPVASALSRSHQEEQAQKLMPVAAGLGALLLGTAMGLAWGESKSLYLGFAALFALVAGYALLTPALTALLTGALRPLMKKGFGLAGATAASSVRRDLSRTGVAVAALTVAVSAAIGMGLMIDGFRNSVAAWLGQTLQSDIYLRHANGSLPLDPPLIDRLIQVPGVTHVGRSLGVTLETPMGPVSLLVVGIPEHRFDGFQPVRGTPTPDFAAFEAGAILISEALAWREGAQVGDSLTLPTAEGPRDFTIGGVVLDYDANAGFVAMSRKAYRRHWRDDRVFSLSLNVAEPERVKETIRLLESAAGPEVELRIRADREIREASLVLFDRTFAITRTLRALAVLTAFFGVLTALLSIQLERTREMGVLRALGLTPAETVRLTLLETGLTGLAAGLLSMPLGWFMGQLLSGVVNQRAFGWSLTVDAGPEKLLLGIVIALPTALAAGLYPAWRTARTPPAEAMRGEE